MKRLAAFAVTMMIAGSTSWAAAQEATPGAGSGHKHPRNPAVEKIFETLKSQKAQIAADTKSGKLTADAASAVTAKLTSIEDEIKADIKANKAAGTHGLTDAQIQSLNQELTANAANIP